MEAINMKIDFASLAFGYTVKAGGGTPNWATALGQGKEYKIHDDANVSELLKGMVYSSVSLSKISTKIGKGGRFSSGNEENSPILIGSVFNKVYINDTLILDGKYILLITRDTSASHAGRLRFKYGPSNKFTSDNETYTNSDFWEKARTVLHLSDNACFFVHDISVRNQEELILRTVFVNQNSSMVYEDSKALHEAWDKLIEGDIKRAGISYTESQTTDESPYGSDVVTGGENILFNGVPGVGKSHKINKIVKDSDYERVVFHPDYTYSDFIGQIMPRLENGKLEYKFVPGPFTNALKKAKDYPNEMHYLIIEEINRGNASAIFGDVFQLLDRLENGESEYGITNFDIAEQLDLDVNAKIKIPSNLTLLATMNTSDQNVFTLDTAFQRRWKPYHIKNEVEKAKHAKENIAGSKIKWGDFAYVINGEIVVYSREIGGSEDKQLGAYFVRDNELGVNTFPEKALKYLLDDAFKLDPDRVFNENIQSLDNLIDEYKDAINNGKDPIKRVMRLDLYNRMMDMSAKSLEEAIDESETFESIPVDEEK